MSTYELLNDIQMEAECEYLSDGIYEDYHSTEECKIMTAIDNPIQELFWDIEFIIKEELNAL